MPAVIDQAPLPPAAGDNGTLGAPLHSCWRCAAGAVAKGKVRDQMCRQTSEIAPSDKINLGRERGNITS